MITIIYDPVGVAVADGEVNWHVSHIVTDVKRDKEYEARYGTGNIFHALRLAIAKDEIPYDSIVFQYNGQDIHVNEYGSIVDWPKGFIELENRLAEDIIRTAHSKGKR